jgi:hypothetical protein
MSTTKMSSTRKSPIVSQLLRRSLQGGNRSSSSSRGSSSRNSETCAHGCCELCQVRTVHILLYCQLPVVVTLPSAVQVLPVLHHVAMHTAAQLLSNMPRGGLPAAGCGCSLVSCIGQVGQAEGREPPREAGGYHRHHVPPPGSTAGSAEGGSRGRHTPQPGWSGEQRQRQAARWVLAWLPR